MLFVVFNSLIRRRNVEDYQLKYLPNVISIIDIELRIFVRIRNLCAKLKNFPLKILFGTFNR